MIVFLCVFVNSCGLRVFLKFSEATSSEGQWEAGFGELPLRKVVALQCLEVRPMWASLVGHRQLEWVAAEAALC